MNECCVSRIPLYIVHTKNISCILWSIDYVNPFFLYVNISQLKRMRGIFCHCFHFIFVSGNKFLLCWYFWCFTLSPPNCFSQFLIILLDILQTKFLFLSMTVQISIWLCFCCICKLNCACRILFNTSCCHVTTLRNGMSLLWFEPTIIQSIAQSLL